MKKLQKFTEPQITSTYAGEFAGQYIAAALLSARTLDNKLITIHPNVKFKEVLQKVAVDGIVQDASCDFVTSGSVVLSERILEPKELQVNLQLCKQEFVDSWQALQLGFSAFDSIPANFNDFLISYVGGKVAEATEKSIWQGRNINGEFLGFETAFSASIAAGGATAVLPARVSGGTSAIISGSITSANVLSVMNSVLDTVPDEVYGKDTVEKEEVEVDALELIEEQMKGDPPFVLVLKRKAFRLYPNKMKIALYYNDKLKKYFSVPYSTEKDVDAPIQAEQVEITEGKEVMDHIHDIVKEKQARKVKFANGKHAMIDGYTASAIKQVHDSVNDENKTKLRKMVHSSPEGLHKVASFAFSKVK
jgi:hypothetical protein